MKIIKNLVPEDKDSIKCPYKMIPKVIIKKYHFTLLQMIKKQSKDYHLIEIVGMLEMEMDRAIENQLVQKYVILKVVEKNL